jgi:thioredoxin 1
MKKWITVCLFLTIALIVMPTCSRGVDKDKADKKKTAMPLNKKKVTFVELGSVKCIPCKMMQPIMKDIAKEYGGEVDVLFYDVWTAEGEPYAKKYGIRAIPTQVFLDEEGKEFFRHEGYYPKDEIVKVLKTRGIGQ